MPTDTPSSSHLWCSGWALHVQIVSASFTFIDFNFIWKGKPCGSKESSSNDHSDNKSVVGKCRLKRRKTSIEVWDGVDKEVVGRLPDDIDGVKFYEIKGTDKKKLVAGLHDGKKWKKKCPTTWSGHLVYGMQTVEDPLSAIENISLWK